MADPVSPMRVLAILAAALALAACGGGRDYRGVAGVDSENRETIFSEGGVGQRLFGGERQEQGTQNSVNPFLWRATLDTFAFMPLVSADPYGGVIISEWFAPPATPDERFKITAYILGRNLRADGLRLSIFRQTRGAGGAWTDAVVNPEMPAELENAVLSRARDLRLRAVEQN